MDFLINILKEIVYSYEFTIIFKIILGTILCSIIGLERQSWNKPAGFKTHTVIGLCGVLIMLLGEYMSRQYGTGDPARLPGQLLSGIGFIGAGTILRTGVGVKGLTTSASILAVTCIGLCVGAGFYLPAIVVTIILYLLLSHAQTVTEALVSHHNVYLTLKVDSAFNGIIEETKQLIIKKGVKIKYIHYTSEKGEKSGYIMVKGKYKAEVDINDIIADIAGLEYVKEVIQELKED